MTKAEIMERADMAETWYGSGQLNWGEIGFDTLTAWVQLMVEQGLNNTLPRCDIESVKNCFYRWWRQEHAVDIK